MCELWSVLELIGKRISNDDDSVIIEKILFCIHAPNVEDLSILTTNNNEFKVPFNL